jgi:hypothetical protein
MAWAARSVSVGTPPRGPCAARKTVSQASGRTRVTQPASTLASVAKLAIVGVWPLFSGSWIVPPQPPVCRSTKLGTLPAAIFSCSGWPLMASPSMNWLCVHTEAMVVISLIVTLAGALAAQHRHQRNRRVVAAALAGCGRAAAGHQVQRAFGQRRTGRGQRKAAIGAAARLRQWPRRAAASLP